MSGEQEPSERFATPDPGRRRRTGAGEVVFAAGKTADQTLALLARLRRDDPDAPALATRCPPAVLDRAPGAFGTAEVAVDPVARTVRVGPCPPARGDVVVVSAGTSDLPVAAECRATLAALGVGAREIVDVGVAGLQRLLDRLDDVARADVVVVVAGMDGVLPGVVRGLVAVPTIGVPTSVGYGVAADGRTALDTMLASCSPGLVVVNIDNGFGAAVHAAAIVHGEAAVTPVAFVDASAGVAGDMLLGALVDAGADVARVRDAVRSLGVPGLDLEVGRDRRGGLACARVRVLVPPAPDRERRLADVLDLAGRAELAAPARALVERVFSALARAEATVHDADPDAVHFHEVGAHDALADVVGVAAAAQDLGLLAPAVRVRCSPVAAGSGTVRTAHGVLPVPAPAVLGLVHDAGLALTGGDLGGERSTPTGVALLAALAAPGPMLSMTVRAVGTGGGSREFDDRPNVVRVVVGEAAGDASPDPAADEVVVLEATVDDADPRVWPSVLAAVRAAGAWDCWLTPTVGRAGRPGQVLTALCPPALRPAVADAVLRHTSSLGVRWSSWRRQLARRRTVRVPVGPPERGVTVAVKAVLADDASTDAAPPTATAEIREAEAAAEVLGWPVRAVCEAAVAAYRTDTTTTSGTGAARSVFET